MGYVGNQTTTAFTSMDKQDITGNGGTSYTLSHAVANANEIEVFVNNVRQEPAVAYNATGTALTMTGNVASTDDFYVVFQGKAIQTATHPNDAPLTASQVNVDNLRLDGNTISSTNGNITLDPSGTNDIVASAKLGVGAAPNTTFGSLLYAQGTPAANKPIISSYSQGNSNNAGLALFNDAGNRGIWTTGSAMKFTRTYEGNSTVDMTIDANGNVIVPSNKLNVGSLGASGGTAGEIQFGGVGGSIDGFRIHNTGGNYLEFRPSSTNAPMVLSNLGHVGIGTTTLTGSGTPDETDNGTGTRILSIGFLGIGRDNGICGQFNRNNAGAILGFRRAGSEVGTISVSNTATAYNTSSDYRLKENVTATWDATTRLKQLNPVRFNFIADADTTVDGFLAHEAQTVVPEAVTGTKDAVEVWKDGEELPDGVSAGDNKLDDDGNTIPVHQGIDQSKLVPLLVKTIIELEARITALEAN